MDGLVAETPEVSDDAGELGGDHPGFFEVFHPSAELVLLRKKSELRLDRDPGRDDRRAGIDTSQSLRASRLSSLIGRRFRQVGSFDLLLHFS